MQKVNLEKAIVSMANLLTPKDKEDCLDYVMELYLDSIGMPTKTKVDLENFRRRIGELSQSLRKEIFYSLVDRFQKYFQLFISNNGITNMTGFSRSYILANMAEDYFAAIKFFYKEFGHDLHLYDFKVIKGKKADELKGKFLY